METRSEESILMEKNWSQAGNFSYDGGEGRKGSSLNVNIFNSVQKSCGLKSRVSFLISVVDKQAYSKED